MSTLFPSHHEAREQQTGSREEGRWMEGQGQVAEVWNLRDEVLRIGEESFQNIMVWVNDTPSVISRNMQINSEMAF